MADLLAKIASGEIWPLAVAIGPLAVAIGVAAVAFMIVAVVVSNHRSEGLRLQVEGELKREMLARGLSVDDIVRVVKATRDQMPEGVDIPSASDVVVESDGEWYAALVLKRDGTKWYVHYVGSEMDENEWVTEDRIRFPASFFARHDSRDGESDMVDARMSYREARLAGKPLGVESEL
jgi:hypothetical protein